MEDTKEEQPSFQCHNCKLLCRSKRQLHFHIDKCLRENKNQDKFKCFRCNRTFIDQRSLSRHQATLCCKAKHQVQLYEYQNRLPFATLTNTNTCNDNSSLSPSKQDPFFYNMEANIFPDNTQNTYFDTYSKSIQQCDYTDFEAKNIDNNCDNVILTYLCLYCDFQCDSQRTLHTHIMQDHPEKSEQFEKLEDVRTRLELDSNQSIDESLELENNVADYNYIHSNDTADAVQAVSVNDDDVDVDDHIMQMANSFFLNQRNYCQVKLLDLLSKHNAPLYLFKEIMDWARHSSIVNKFDFELQPNSREKLLKDMIYHNKLQSLLPKIVTCKLPFINESVNVTTHSISESIYSLLYDSDLMREENLIFDNDPLEDPEKRVSSVYTDINDGNCYINAYKHYCTDKRFDVLCPLILFIDKTHTDAKGNQKIEPIIFTLGIFNKATRNKENAWRTIGFIPSMEKFSSKNVSTDQRNADYHFLLKVVLSPLAALQSQGGLPFSFKYKNTIFDVNLKIPILFVTGDSEGQDRIVGRKVQYNLINDGSHICRYCNVPYNELDNPLFLDQYNQQFTRASELEFLLRTDTETLTNLGYADIGENVFHTLQYCDLKHGINGSVPADLLHTLQHGIYLYIFECLLASKQTYSELKTSKNTQDANNRKRKKQSKLKPLKKRKPKKVNFDSDEDSVGNGLNSEDLSTRNVFNEKQCAAIDKKARFIGKQLQHQSDRNLPRTYFDSGITSHKKKNGHEEQGVILVWMFVLLSDARESFITLYGGNELGESRLNNWLYVCERIIMVEELIKASEIDKNLIIKFKHWFLIFLDLFKDVLDRQKGHKLKLLKFHLLTHLADDIEKFGVPSSFNTCAGESNHKGHKKNVKRTQRQPQNFEEQAGLRYVENLAIAASLRNMPQYGKRVQCENHSASGDTSQVVSFGGNSYFMNEAGIFLTQGKRTLQQANWPDSNLQNQIFQLLSQNILPHVNSKTINLFTLLKTEDLIYRADPCFMERPWLDWAFCNWGTEDGVIPIHLLLFIDLSHLTRNIIVNDVPIEGPGRYVIAHMIGTEISNDFAAFPKSRLFFTAEKLLNKKSKVPLIAIISVDCICGPCIAVNTNPDSVMVESIGSHSYTFLKSRHVWTDELKIAIEESEEKESLR